MTKRFQGLNINAQLLNEPEKQQCLSIMQAMDAISHTTMDDWSFTVRAANLMPQTMFAHRSWNPFQVHDDTKTYEYVSPEQWANRVHGFPKLENVWHHMLNEPSSANVARLVDWMIEAMNLTGRDGKYPTKCLVGNFAVDKSFQHAGDRILWQDDWLRFYRAFEQHIGWHKVGYHRYWIGDVRLAYVNGYPANIRLEHPNHGDYLDPSKHRLSLERLPNGDLPPHWTGYADLWVKLLCIENGIQLPEEMESEGIHDEKRDTGSKPYNEYVDTNYPTEYNGGRGRGLWTWRKWSEASSGKPYIQSLKEQLIARNKMHLQLEKDYPQLKGKQHGAHLFSYTKANDWEAGGFSVFPIAGHRDEGIRTQFLYAMANVPEFDTGDSVTKPIPEPILFDPPLYPYNVSVKHGTWNLRAAMATGVSIEILGELSIQPLFMEVSRVTNNANGYDWYKFKWNGQTGYFADSDKLVLQSIDDTTPEPDPVPDTPTDKPDLTLPETWRRLEEASKQWAREEILARDKRIDALEKALADKQETVHIDVPFPDATYTTTKAALNSDIQFWKMLHQIAGVIVNRLENPTPTMAQVANDIYKVESGGTSLTGKPYTDISAVTSSLLNIKPRGDSLFLEADNSDDDDLADPEPIGIAS